MSRKSPKSDVGSPKSENVESVQIKNKSEIEHSKSAIVNGEALLSTLKKQTKAKNRKSEISMEVHHHPEVEKKNFKEYLLEGLMIFLAVMMGFIAENIRESISEHKRASEFARSYFEDIKKDTAALHAAQRFSKHKMASLDSALAILHAPAAQQNDTLLYLRSSVISNIMPFEPSAGSYEQIKSSGSLRYFDQKLVNLMNEYDVQVKKTVKREDIDLALIRDQIIPFGTKTLNTEVLYDIYFLHKISHELYIADKNQRVTRQWINYMIIAKIERLRAEAEYNKQLEIADEVIAELKKEYNLNDE